VQTAAGATPHAGEVGVIVLIAFKPGSPLRALGWLTLGRFLLRTVPGLFFFKVLGSGRDAGFEPAPGLRHQGLFCAFRDDASADGFIATSPAMSYLHAHARELFSAKLRATSIRGSWAGTVPLRVTATPQAGEPVASLTRASIRPHKALAFWRHAAPAQKAVEVAPGCILSAGLGEAPLLRQATFTVWASQASMDAFARNGPHLEAIRATRETGYFSEDLFARFRIDEMRGTWKGRNFAPHQY